MFFLKKILSLSIIVYSKCSHEYEKYLKQKNQLKYQKFLVQLIILKSIMSGEDISQEFRLKIIDETRNYLIKEINQNELMSKKYKKVYKILNYIEHYLF